MQVQVSDIDSDACSVSIPATPKSPTVRMGAAATAMNTVRQQSTGLDLSIPLVAALNAGRPVDGDIARMEIGELLSPLDEHGHTLLHVAARFAKAGTVTAIQQRIRAQVEAEYHERITALRRACVEAGHGSLVKGGLLAGDTPSKAELANQALGEQRLMELRCEALWIAALLARDSAGRTPLHDAAEARGAMLRQLLRTGGACYSAPLRFMPGGEVLPRGSAVRLSDGAAWDVRFCPMEYKPVDAAAALSASMAGFASIAGGEMDWAGVADHVLLRAGSLPERATHSEPGPHGHVLYTGAACTLRDALVHVQDLSGLTPLHLAVMIDDTAAAGVLIALGADPAAEGEGGVTPLDLAHSAATRAKLAPLDITVANAVAPGGGELSLASSTASFKRSGTQPQQQRDSPGQTSTANLRASKSGGLLNVSTPALATLQAVVGTGVDVNARSGVQLRTPLHLAAMAGDVQITQYLLAQGAVVDAVDSAGATALHIAATNCGGGAAWRAVASALLQAGANPAATTSTRNSPLHAAAIAVAGQVDVTGLPSRELAGRVLRAAQDHAASFAADATPRAAPEQAGFHSPDLTASAGTLARTTSRAAARSARDPCGPAAADTARMLQLLLDAGAPPNATNDSGDSPLHVAADRGRTLAVHALLQAGVKVYLRNATLQTALHSAAKRGHVECVRLLVRHDAEYGVLKLLRNGQGRYAYDVAYSETTRVAMHTLWESAAAGDLDGSIHLIREARQRMVAADQDAEAQATSPEQPWQPCDVWSRTRVLARAPLHCVITGAAAALRKAQTARRDAADALRGSVRPALSPAQLGRVPGGAGHGLLSGNVPVAAFLSRGPPTSGFDASKARGAGDGPQDPDASPATPSAVHIRAGVGLRFTKAGSVQDAAYTKPPARLPPPQALGTSSPLTGRSSTGARSPSGQLLPSARFTTTARVAGGKTHAIASRTGVDIQHPADARLLLPYARLVALLVQDCGAAVDSPDADEATPLMLAAKYGLHSLVHALLDAGAQPDAVDGAGNTALAYACAYQQAEIAQDLRSAYEQQLADRRAQQQAAAAAASSSAGSDAGPEPAFEEAGTLDEQANAQGVSPADLWGQPDQLHDAPASADLMMERPARAASVLGVAAAY